jgi:hypothetical protein
LHGWLLRRPYRAVRHFILNWFMRAKPVTSDDSKSNGTGSSHSTEASTPSRAA